VKPFNFRWTDSAGVEHFYPNLFGWHCDIHKRVCDPFKPVTTDDLLRLAAKDKNLDDDAFVVLRQSAEGREIGGKS
jgi:hypothetical protein